MAKRYTKLVRLPRKIEGEKIFVAARLEPAQVERLDRLAGTRKGQFSRVMRDVISAGLAVIEQQREENGR